MEKKIKKTYLVNLERRTTVRKSNLVNLHLRPCGNYSLVHIN